MDYKEFYIGFGRLLYAIAKADGYIQMTEYAEFADIVSTELHPLEEKFNFESSFKTLFEFKDLSDKDVDVDEAFTQFTDFLKANKDEVDAEMKQLCLNAAQKVAESYAGVDENEQALLDRLKTELDNI
jgi:tellurite resistance protein